MLEAIDLTKHYDGTRALEGLHLKVALVVRALRRQAGAGKPAATGGSPTGPPRTRARPAQAAGRVRALRMALPFWLLPAALAAVADAAAGAPPDPPESRYVVPRLDAPIRMTGTVSDPAWDRIAPLPLTVQHPEFGMPPTERTEIRIAHDGRYLYASCRCFHADPAGVRAYSFFRDQWLNDDTFSLLLDTFNDKETGVHLYTNPLGTKFDAQIYNDAELTPNGLPRQSEWDTFWDVAARITDEGWFAEMRIPLSSLQFEEMDGEVTMGLIAYRLIWGKNERHIFPAIPPDWSRSYYKPSVARAIVLEGVRTRPAVHVTPFALAGHGGRVADPHAAAGPDWIRHRPAEVGLDVRYAFRRPLALDVTVNTDFAQAEADDEQINLDRFSLFVPEKRRFFLERASLFDFPLGGLDRLFHSRRAGLTDAGRAQRILGGGRLVGRIAGWDAGLLNLQTAAAGAVPGENLGVLRARRQVLNPNSLVGGMVTTRLADGGERQVAFGVDADFNLAGDDYLTLRWAQVLDGGRAGPGLDAAHLDARLERRRQTGLFYRGVVTRSGPDFDPALGFVARNGFRRIGDQLGYGWRPDGGPVRRHAAAVRGNAFFRDPDGVLESSELGPEWEVDFRNAAGATVGIRLHTEDVAAEFRLSDEAVIPAGAYRYTAAQARFVSRAGRPYRVQARGGAGGFFDGRRAWAETSVSWNLSRHLELSGVYQQNRLRFPARDQRLSTHLARLRARAALNSGTTASAFVQYNSLRNTLAANVRFRHHVRDGTDLWVVYNHGFTTDAIAAPGIRPETTDRALIVKYAHTVSF